MATRRGAVTRGAVGGRAITAMSAVIVTTARAMAARVAAAVATGVIPGRLPLRATTGLLDVVPTLVVAVPLGNPALGNGRLSRRRLVLRLLLGRGRSVTLLGRRCAVVLLGRGSRVASIRLGRMAAVLLGRRVLLRRRGVVLLLRGVS